jgi:hypothetical protein
MNKLYTIGYQGLRGVYSLLHLAVPLDCTIVDIRYQPWSWNERWREQGLLDRLCDLEFGRLKCRYTHIEELGNVNYNREGQPIQLMHAEVGIARLSEQLKRKPCLLLCQCQSHLDCHRKVVAELAQQWLGCEVEHLAVSPGGQAIRAVDLAGMVAVPGAAGVAHARVAVAKQSNEPQGQMSLW